MGLCPSNELNNRLLHDIERQKVLGMKPGLDGHEGSMPAQNQDKG